MEVRNATDMNRQVLYTRTYRKHGKPLLNKKQEKKLRDECIRELVDYNMRRVGSVIAMAAIDGGMEAEYTVCFPYARVEYIKNEVQVRGVSSSMGTYIKHTEHMSETDYTLYQKCMIIDTINKRYGTGFGRSPIHNARVPFMLELLKYGYKVDYDRGQPGDRLKIKWDKPSRKKLLRGIVRFVIITIRYRDDFYAPGGPVFMDASERFENAAKKQKH